MDWLLLRCVSSLSGVWWWAFVDLVQEVPASGGSKSVDDVPVLTENDLYVRMKELEAQLETLNIQEEYIKDEQKNLKRELLRAQEEVKRIQSVPLVIGQFLEMIDPTTGIVGSTTGMFL